jgi:TAG lipase/lysophosphatidylethanolamine acyltransferase
MRRIRRYAREGYLFDVKVLEDCVKANVGDLTFEEAYNRSKRVLNITVATGSQGGVPTLLNYLTAPNVVSTPTASKPSQLTCRDS